MRVMVIVKATKKSEGGINPSDPGFAKLVEEMGKFNEELVKAGVILSADGLHPSSRGKRVFVSPSGEKRTVVDGPFAETKELISGFWIWQVKSMDEAVDWIMRCPQPMPGEEAQIEIRPIIEAEEFGEDFARGKEERMRAVQERSRS